MTREEAIRELMFAKREVVADSFIDKAYDMAISALKAQIDKDIDVPNNDDIISRHAAIELIERMKPYHQEADDIAEMIANMPSAQPEQRTCVNCGRTVNNGGWYADGRTRCPIEEHYALPKDGYCHLWEKRNVTDDDYPERREE